MSVTAIIATTSTVAALQLIVGILLLFMVGAVVKGIYKWGFSRTDYIGNIIGGGIVGVLLVIILGMVLFVASAFV